MSFIRPEAHAALMRWREVVIGVAVISLGVFWIAGSGGLLGLLGYGVAGLGVVMVVAGIQRARFRTGSAGPGVVQVTEGRVAYFGPLTGGAVDLADLEALTLDASADPPHWVLHQLGTADLQIPLGAKGEDALFDAFAQLPGIRTETMLANLQKGADVPVVIWRSASARSRAQRLH